MVCDRDAKYIEWEPVGNGVLAKTKRRLQAGFVRSFNFDWPTNDTVTTRLRDVLESNVDEKYYLSDEKTAKLVAQLESKGEPLVNKDVKMVGHAEIKGHDYNKRVYSVDGVSRTLNTKSDVGRSTKIAEPQIIEKQPIMVGRLEQGGHDQRKRVYDADGISPSLNGIGNGGGHEPKIVVEALGNTNPSGRGINGNVYDSNGLSPTLTTNKGEGLKVVEYSREYGIGKELDVAHTLNSSDWRGLNRNQMQNAVVEVRPVLTPDRQEKRQNGRRFKDDGEESFTLTGQDRHGVAVGWYPRYRIRKLTPLECWRLQGFSDKVFFTVRAAGVSDSQLYKQAGNTVTIHKVLAVGEKLLPLMESGGVNENDL